MREASLNKLLIRNGKKKSNTQQNRYYALCHTTLIEHVVNVAKIEQSLHGQTILMDRLCVINRYISSSEGGKDTSAKGAELRRIVAEAAKKRRRAESLLEPTLRKKSIHPHLDAKMLVSPLYPKMNLTRVLPNACTVFKSALRPMLMRFEVKLASTFSIHDLLGNNAVSITRNDCVATRVRFCCITLTPQYLCRIYKPHTHETHTHTRTGTQTPVSTCALETPKLDCSRS